MYNLNGPMRENVEKYFREYRGTYEKVYNSGFWRAYRRLAYRRLTGAAPASGPWSVLDIGGGALLSLPDLLEDARVREYVVVDLISHLPEGLPKVRFVQSDALSFLQGCPPANFDLAVIFGLLMYMEPAEARAVLSKLAGALRPGAAVVVHEAGGAGEAHLVTEGGLERSVDLAKLVEGLPFRLIVDETYDVLPLRRLVMAADRLLVRLLGRGVPARLFLALLGFERALGAGVDRLWVLRREG